MSKVLKYGMICLLFLFLVLFHCLDVKPTFAKFSDDYMTEQDAVSLQLNFDIGVSNISEYEEIRVSSNSYEVLNVNVFNGTADAIYYGIWYQLIDLDDKDSSDIVVAKLDGYPTPTSGKLEYYADETASIIIKNNSVNDIIVYIGVASSNVSENDIEYLGGRQLISGSASEVDYYYDVNKKMFVSVLDNNQYFMLNDFTYQDTLKEGIFEAGHKGIYEVDVWSGSLENHTSRYTSGLLALDEREELYLNVGKNEEKNAISSIRVGSSSLGVDNRIMYAGLDEEYYISGHYGSVSSHFLNDELSKTCKTGLEDILCSYHESLKYFTHTSVLDASLVNKPDNVLKKENGFIKIKPVVPLIEDNDYSVLVGESFDLSKVKCIDGGSGCYIVKTVPTDTADLPIGNQNISFIVTDDSGVVYRYTYPLKVLEKE